MISKDQEKLGQVAIDDMAAIIIRGYGSTVSVNICSRLSHANVPIVFCVTNQSPDSVLWPLSERHAQGQIMTGQSAIRRLQKKRLWQQLVCTKINTQAQALTLVGENANDLYAISKRVKAGDPENLEAQATRCY